MARYFLVEIDDACEADELYIKYQLEDSSYFVGEVTAVEIQRDRIGEQAMHELLHLIVGAAHNPPKE